MLRIALIIPPESPPAWAHDLVACLLAQPFVQVCLVIRDTAASPVSDCNSGLLWRLYRHLDSRWFGRQTDAARACDLGELLAGIPACELHVPSAAPSAMLDVIQRQQLDVMIHLGSSRPNPRLPAAARSGVWWYRYSGHRAIAPSVVGLREMLEGEPIVVSELVQTTADNRERVIYCAIARTISFSLRKNRDNIYRKGATFVARKLRDLERYGEAGLVEHEAWEIPDSDLGMSAPGNIGMLSIIPRLAGRIALRAWQKLAYVEQWFVAYRFGNETGMPAGFDDFNPMLPPKDRIWADPFPIERDGRYYVFIEELPFVSNKGHISVVEFDQQGGWKKPVKVLERDYHMSYPFLFEWQGDLYMLPETGHNRSVEVYRCHRFPDDWRLEAVLLEDVNCADATLAQIGERWWMFVNIGEEGTELYDELHLYHADQPFGPWTAHPRNPVKSDARTARPAGNLFWSEGRLYRPAQCCVPLYGSALTLNRVELIDEENFVEQQVARINADWRPGLLGLHTFNWAGRLSVIDGFKRTQRFSLPKSYIKKNKVR